MVLFMQHGVHGMQRMVSKIGMSVPGTAFESTRDVSNNLLNFLSALLFVLLFRSICWTQIRPGHEAGSGRREGHEARNGWETCAALKRGGIGR